MQKALRAMAEREQSVAHRGRESEMKPHPPEGRWGVPDSNRSPFGVQCCKDMNKNWNWQLSDANFH